MARYSDPEDYDRFANRPRVVSANASRWAWGLLIAGDLFIVWLFLNYVL